ncbi:porin family protein [Pedobacter sp. P351]|uniref:porin family protein n=1 Tax=Pedobacter superstes TaxID=3133441 RepID=UPI00309B477C
MIKNLINSILLLLISSTCLFSQVRFGIKAGPNFANIQSTGGEDADLGILPLYITSFHIGGLAEFKISRILFFQPGISLSGKGYKIDYSSSSDDYSESLKGNANLLYMEAPLNIIAKFKAGSGNFLIGSGPYIGYALSGKSKTDIKVDAPGTEDDFSINSKEDMEFGKEENQINPLDFGVNFISGYELKRGIFATLGFGLGLKNMSNSSLETTKNKIISLSFGYKF